MRQIKFRVWNGEKMLYPEFFGTDAFGSKGLITIGWSNQPYIDLGSIGKAPYEAREGCTLMQFTGLLDCEGKEVYEGDVLEYKDYHANIKWWSTVEEIPSITKRTEQQRQDFRIEKNTVRFDNGSFCLGYTSLYTYCINNVLVDHVETGSHHHCDYEDKQWDFKVIGNIFQQSHLITE